MKYVEIKETNIDINTTTEPGIYLKAGMLWIAPGNGMYPLSCLLGQINIKTKSDEASGGMNEDFILKLLAIGNKPNSVHKFTGS